MGRGMIRDYLCSRSTMQLPSTENNFRQHLLHHNTSFLAFSINELKIVRVKKSHERARAWDFCLTSMYEVILLMSYCWRFIVQRIGYIVRALKYHTATDDKQTYSFQSPFEPIFPIYSYQCDFVWFIIFQNSYFSLRKKKNGKISSQPYPTKCIQFLDRENNDKNTEYVAIGKTDLFPTAMYCFCHCFLYPRTECIM